MHKTIKFLLLPIFTLTLFSSFAFPKDPNILAYKDRGVKYYPKYVKKGTVQYGKASWYGKPFHGRLTANGERYNMYKMTAAHRTYAIGTILKVTNLKNRRSVRVRVNDRGPFYSSRMIDLSYGAAKKLGIVKKGIGRIKIEVISSGKKSFTKKKSYKIATKQIEKKKILRTQKIQVASFFSKSSAKLFKTKHKLTHAVILKKYLPKYKKNTYQIVVKCTNWEAKQILKSKKFAGAYKIS